MNVKERSVTRSVAALGSVMCLLCGAARADVDAAAVESAKNAFLSRMVEKHGFEKASLAATLDGIKINDKILETISKPVERVVPWYEYRKIFLTNERIGAGADFWMQHAAEVEAASERYGVAPEMLVAILGVETYFGQRMGTYRVLDALGTLAFAYPPRSRFFASELESFLLMSREEGPAVLDAVGSYAGAMGAGQFIPSSFRAYAVDADGDGRRDVWHDWDDILGSVANYFEVHGWQRAEPVADRAELEGGDARPPSGNALDFDHTVDELKRMGYKFSSALPGTAPAAVVALEGEGGATEYWIGYRNFRVITRYNSSPKYALAAFELSQAIRDAYFARTAE
ncbi:MAG TPA: lytic murein transglycosylase B [Gammaproteobacteria bacterium]|nr:lytic murein transglycosylase B [Gammaproteobacteria bacterium]